MRGGGGDRTGTMSCVSTEGGDGAKTETLPSLGVKPYITESQPCFLLPHGCLEILQRKLIVIYFNFSNTHTCRAAQCFRAGVAQRRWTGSCMCVREAVSQPENSRH